MPPCAVERFRKNIGEQSCRDAVHVRRADADGDQREHIEASIDDRLPAALEERPTAPEHDRRGEDELKPREQTRRALVLQRLARQHVRHRDDEQRQRKAALIQNRRVMSTSSGLGSSSRLTVRGSRAMPQIGQEPGSCRTISGCMGQTYSVLVKGAAGAAGSKAMPHLGQAPGPVCRTSGCIGQTYTASPGLFVVDVCALPACGQHVRRAVRAATSQDLV